MIQFSPIIVTWRLFSRTIAQTTYHTINSKPDNVARAYIKKSSTSILDTMACPFVAFTECDKSISNETFLTLLLLAFWTRDRGINKVKTTCYMLFLARWKFQDGKLTLYRSDERFHCVVCGIVAFVVVWVSWVRNPVPPILISHFNGGLRGPIKGPRLSGPWSPWNDLIMRDQRSRELCYKLTQSMIIIASPYMRVSAFAILRWRILRSLSVQSLVRSFWSAMIFKNTKKVRRWFPTYHRDRLV